MTKYIAISIGDMKGIGIQILLTTWKKKEIKDFILFTDIKLLHK